MFEKLPRCHPRPLVLLHWTRGSPEARAKCPPKGRTRWATEVTQQFFLGEDASAVRASASANPSSQPDHVGGRLCAGVQTTSGLEQVARRLPRDAQALRWMTWSTDHEYGSTQRLSGHARQTEAVQDNAASSTSTCWELWKKQAVSCPGFTFEYHVVKLHSVHSQSGMGPVLVVMSSAQGAGAFSTAKEPFTVMEQMSPVKTAVEASFHFLMFCATVTKSTARCSLEGHVLGSSWMKKIIV